MEGEKLLVKNRANYFFLKGCNEQMLEFGSKFPLYAMHLGALASALASR